MIGPNCNSDEHMIKADMRDTHKRRIQCYHHKFCSKYFYDFGQKYSKYRSLAYNSEIMISRSTKDV